MRCLFLSLLLLFLDTGSILHAADFDYYLFSLSWSPEYCHAHPKDRTAECNAQAKMNFVVHGLWPSNKNGSDPTGCPNTPFDRAGEPKGLLDVMPANILAHEWTTHGVCSGMTESVYFQKLLSLFNGLSIPIKNMGQNQQLTPAAIRQQLAQANAGTTPASFTVQDNGGYLTEVRSCWDRAFKPISCPSPGDTRNVQITIRARP